MENWDMMCAVRRRLGIAVVYANGEANGHDTFADNMGGRLNPRHSYLLAAWRQVFYEAGGVRVRVKVPKQHHKWTL